jgi:hypothetical protein
MSKLTWDSTAAPRSPWTHTPEGTDSRPADARAPGWQGLRELAPVAAIVLLVYQTQARLFLTHEWIQQTWGDWIAHAYRARFLSTWGLVNWSPDWNAGLPLFQAYQTAPHVLTVALATLFDLSITHSMMIWTAVTLLFPAGAYVALRRLGAGVWGALLGAVLVFDSATIGPPIQDFSYLFGLALVPLLFWFAVGGLGTTAGYAGAVALGLSPYLHPYGTVAGVAVLVVRILLDRVRVNRRIIVQGLVAVLVSSFYWLPYLISAKPAYTNPWNWSTVFARGLFARTGYWGLSAGVAAAAALTLAALSARRLDHHRITICAFGGAAILATAVFLHLHGMLPRGVMAIEPSRWMPLVSVLLALGCAPLGDALAQGRRTRADEASSRPATRALLAVVLAAGIVGGAAEGAAWFRAAGVSIGDRNGMGDEMEGWAVPQPHLARPVMSWANPNDVAFASYFTFGRFHFPGDYIVTRQWTVASPELTDAINTPDSEAPGRFARAERYLRMYGVRYLHLRRDHPAHAALVDGPSGGRLRVVGTVPGGWIAEVPWEPIGAFVAPLAALRKTNLPDLEFLTDQDRALRERRIDAYNALKYGPAARPAEMTWHSPTRLTIAADARPGDALLVPQNWDTVWTAKAGGRDLPVERAGPNFFAVRLDSRSGPLVVDVEHGLYPTWTAAFAMVGLGLLIAALAAIADVRTTRRAGRG